MNKDDKLIWEAHADRDSNIKYGIVTQDMVIVGYGPRRKNVYSLVRDQSTYPADRYKRPIYRDVFGENELDNLDNLDLYIHKRGGGMQQLEPEEKKKVKVYKQYGGTVQYEKGDKVEVDLDHMLMSDNSDEHGWDNFPYFHEYESSIDFSSSGRARAALRSLR